MTSIFSVSGFNSIKDYLKELNHSANHDDSIYIKLEEEINKLIVSNFICAKVESMDITDSNPYILVYFLNENGSIFYFYLEQKGGSYNSIWDMDYSDSSDIIKSNTKDSIIKSKFESKESYKINKDDIIVTIFNNCSFNYNNSDKILIKQFVLLCEDFIERRTNL